MPDHIGGRYSALTPVGLLPMGQYIQDGRKNLFETILNVELPKNDITITKVDDDLDGGVPNLIINIPEISPFDQPGVEAYKKNKFKLLGK